MSPAVASLLAMGYLIRPLAESEPTDIGSAQWWIYLGISTFLVIFAGIMSGLTLGLMSISPMDLEVLQRSGTDKEKQEAAAIQPVVAKQHQLLVTLLLCNAGAMEALPIFLDKMFNPVVAVILSVTFVLAFGEVIPQALCSRYGLAIGANLLWLVKILMFLCYPIAYPVGKCLDIALGHDDVFFRRAQLKALVSIHAKEAGKGGELSHDETTIISGALDLTEKTAEEAMTPIESTFSLDVNTKLDWEAMGKIITRGHSRIPVYAGSPRNIIGILLVKSLLTVRAEQETPVSAVSIRRIPRVPADMPLYDILNEFQKGSSHMAAVVKSKAGKRLPRRTSHAEALKMAHSLVKKPEADLEKGPTYFTYAGDEEEARQRSDELSNMEGQAFLENGSSPQEECRQVENSGPGSDDVEDEVIGIITLEDVIEELLQEEIVDETDEYVDVHKRIRVAAAAAQVAKHPSIRRVNSYRSVERRADKAQAVVSAEESSTKGRGVAFRGKSANALTEPLLVRFQ